jgi:glycosyltransferase involved in cell wall biosynthesis
VLTGTSARSRARWAAGEFVAVPRAAARAGVDVLHSPANFAPPAGPFARVLTLHDLLHRERPELVSPAVRLATEALLRPGAARAHRVITVSHASAAVIARELGLPAGRLAVVPNGLAAPIRPGDAAAARRRLAAGDRRVALAVATALPHKNLPGLLAGLAALAPRERPLLALAGHGTDGAALADTAADLGVGADVRLLGAVGGGELEDLYAAADALVTATRYEGFGLPVLDAMSRGIPVACSDLPVLREVAADAAVYLRPDDPHSIATALRAALAGGPDGRRRVELGRRRAEAFSWERAADATLGVYEAALESARRGPR